MSLIRWMPVFTPEVFEIKLLNFTPQIMFVDFSAVYSVFVNVTCFDNVLVSSSQVQKTKVVNVFISRLTFLPMYSILLSLVIFR